MNEDEVVGTGQSTEMLQSQNAISAQEAQGATTTAANNALNDTIGQQSQLGIQPQGQNQQGAMNASFQYDQSQFNAGNFGNYANTLQGLYQQQWNNYQQNAQNAYDMNKQDLLDYQANVPKPYQQQANQLGVQQEQNQKNYNMYAQYNGINTGSASQSALAMQNTYAQQQANIATARANAEKDAQKAVVDLETQYRNQLAEALGNYQFEFAQGIYGLMQNQDTYKQTIAATYAQYGDFSMYEDLGYSPDVIAGMKVEYLMNNPDGANAQQIAQDLVDTGRMTEAQVYSQTGISINGYRPSSSGGSFYTSYYWTHVLGHDAVYGADGTSAGGYSAAKSNAFKNGNYNVGGTSYVAKAGTGSKSGTSSNQANNIPLTAGTRGDEYTEAAALASQKLRDETERLRNSGYSQDEIDAYFMGGAGKSLMEEKVAAERASGSLIDTYLNDAKNAKTKAEKQAALDKANLYQNGGSTVLQNGATIRNPSLSDYQKQFDDSAAKRDIADANRDYHLNQVEQTHERVQQETYQRQFLDALAEDSLPKSGYSRDQFDDATVEGKQAMIRVGDINDTVQSIIDAARANGFGGNKDIEYYLNNPSALQQLIQATSTKNGGRIEAVPRVEGDTRTDAEILVDMYNASKLIADGKYVSSAEADYYKDMFASSSWYDVSETDYNKAVQVLNSISSDWRNGIEKYEYAQTAFTNADIQNALNVVNNYENSAGNGIDKATARKYTNALKFADDYSYVSGWIEAQANGEPYVDSDGNLLQAPTQKQKDNAEAFATAIQDYNNRGKPDAIQNVSTNQANNGNSWDSDVALKNTLDYFNSQESALSRSANQSQEYSWYSDDFLNNYIASQAYNKGSWDSDEALENTLGYYNSQEGALEAYLREYYNGN